MRLGLEALPDDYRRNVIIWVYAIVAAAGFFAVIGKRFDWQRLDPVQTCPHCLKVHGAAGIAATIADGFMFSSIAILGIEPFCAALRAVKYPPLDLSIAVLIVSAAIVALLGLGFTARLPSGNRAGATRGDVVANLVAGTRVTAIVVVIWMFAQGFGRMAIASRLTDIFGSRLGPRLQSAIGAAAVRDTLVVLLVGCILSTVARWLIPWIAGSKPLVFMRPNPRKAVAA